MNGGQSSSIRSVYFRSDEEDVGQDNEHEYLIPNGSGLDVSYGSSPSAEPQENGSKMKTRNPSNGSTTNNKRGSSFMTWATSDTDLSLWECLYLTLILLAIGVTVFSLLVEKWSFVESLYFTLVLLTTVGYGDMAPTTPAGKMFTAIFALCGVFVIGLALGVVGSELVDAEIDVLIEKVAPSKSMARQASSSFYDSSRKVGQICWLVIRILSPIFIGALIIAYLEGWPWYDALYYTIITATTVGLGDLSPTSDWSEACAILFIPLAVAAMAHILDECSTFVMKRRREKHSQKLRNLTLTEGDLDVLDTAKDGQVSRLEYVEFMLKALNKVDEHLFEELHAQFDMLDATKDGVLTMSDFELRVDENVRRLSMRDSLTATEQSYLGKISKLCD